jgi:hypothetical protein
MTREGTLAPNLSVQDFPDVDAEIANREACYRLSTADVSLE